jgi:site-specific DNA recombinase
LIDFMRAELATVSQRTLLLLLINERRSTEMVAALRKGKPQSISPSTPKRVAIYCRVSTGRQREEGTSLEKQLLGCLEKATEFGLKPLSDHVIKSYVDRIEKGGEIAENGIYMEDFSGRFMTERPVLSKLRAAVRARQYDVVICYSTDRFSREMVHRFLLKREFKASDCRLVYATQDFGDGPQAVLLESVDSYMDQVEIERIKDRTINGKRLRLQHGKIHRFGDELFGYRRDFERGVRVPDPEQVRLIEYIYRLCADEQLGCWAIARRLNNEGIPSPQSHKKPNARWQGRTVNDILRRRDYIGESELWKTVTETDEDADGRRVVKRRRRDKSERIQLAPEITPPIIDRKLWDRAQEQLDNNNGSGYRNSLRPCLLRGMIYCAVCRKAMYIGGGGKEKDGSIKPSRYRCNTNMSAKDSERCTGRTCIQDRTDEFIWNLIVDKMRESNAISAEVERYLERDPDPQLKIDLDLVQTSKAKLKSGLKSLVDKLATCDSEIVSDLLGQRIAENEKLIVQLDGEERELQMRIKSQETKTSSLKFLKRVCENFYDRAHKLIDLDGRRRLLQVLGVRVYADGYRFKVTWRFDPTKSAGIEEEYLLVEGEATNMDRRKQRNSQKNEESSRAIVGNLSTQAT